MFALRFDPNNIVEEAEVERKVSSIPLKRRNSKHNDDRSDDSEGDKVKDHESEGKAELPDEIDIDGQITLSRDGEPLVDDHNDTSESENLEVDVDVEMENGEDIPKRHTSVMSRFAQTISLQEKIAHLEGLDNVDSHEVPEATQHALEQIPQPAIVRNNTKAQSFKEHKSVAWLNASKIHYDDSMSKPFSSFSEDLEPRLSRNIEKYFSSNSFPIQTILLENILPVLNFSLATTRKHLTRRVGDVLVNASTGSGKTLAYCIPVVQLLSKRTINRLRALIIVPTKLLINQVYDTLSKLAQGSSLIISMSRSENSLKEENRKLLQLEPDVLIITPGRLVDHLQMKSINMKNLSMLILDEADHLLNQSFQNWCPELMNQIRADKLDQRPGNVIKMVFSATLTTNTEKLHGLNLYNPKLFITDSVKLYNLPGKLQEHIINIPTAKSSYKPLILLHLLDRLLAAKILVFVKSNEASLRLACLLEILIGKGIGKQHAIHSINSNNSKAENKRLVNDFASAECGENNTVLITTDLMSRGIDINDISDVINYDLPISSQQYVHRCGRTARAQSSGNAYNLLIGKGEREFWKNQIDEDISRAVNGLSPKTWENDTSLDTSDDSNHALNVISADEEESYRNSLETLKQKVTSK